MDQLELKKVKKRLLPKTHLRRIKMRRLIDHWTPTVLVLFSFVKVLQFVRLLGFASKEGGWRTAARAYLRTEHSKFSLTAFRLLFWSDCEGQYQRDFVSAKRHIIKRLHIFLQKVPSSQWQIIWKKFSAVRVRKKHVDLVEVEFDENGNILRIDPWLDPRYDMLSELGEADRENIKDWIITVYNQFKNVHDKIRPWFIRERIYRNLLLQKKISKTLLQLGSQYVERILSSTFVSFEVLPRDHKEFDQRRFQDPQFIKKKHPGQGLLNIVCRLNAALDQVDLWMQINHVPVDGVPMQEVLAELKKEWGTAGELQYPPLASKRRVEPVLCTTKKGKKAIYSAYRFIDFRSLLALRKELNTQHAPQIGCQITLLSMLLWGLAHHEILNNKKFLCTLEISGDEKTERSPGVVFIRPSKFIDPLNRRAGFLNFQIEFNQILEATRSRHSESYELMEIYALTSPIVYWFTRKCMPKALAEFVGTVGITMIRDADIFLSPLSDINTDGFLAFGNFTRPTVDGHTCGYVSARAPEEKVNVYLDAVEKLALDFNAYI
jgi:hypothetical protein